VRYPVLAVGLAMLLAGAAGAYEQYSENKDATNCRDCHGDFRASPYTSLSDDQSWGDDLHDVHRDVMLDGDCDTCHTSGGRFPVLLGSSNGGDGLDPISCAGCHGRAADGTGSGSEGYSAGLRQHHWRAGVEECGGCHDDADPAFYIPVDEDVPPPYYSGSDAAHPLIPSDPCNRAADGFPEDFAGSSLGLDNDGDGLYDELDVTACPEPAPGLLLGTALGVLALLTYVTRGAHAARSRSPKG
jgi:hypothetical protein